MNLTNLTKNLMKSVFVAGALFCCATEAVAVEFVNNPTIAQNPNPSAPLVAILTFSPDQKVSTDVEVNNGTRSWTLHFDASHDPSKGLILAGMRADTEHTFTVTITGSDGTKAHAAETLSYTTPPLPKAGYDFPPVQVLHAEPEKMEAGLNGMTILSVRRGALGRTNYLSENQMKFTRHWGMLLGLDNSGEIIWYYESPMRFEGVEVLKNGNILFHLHDFRSMEIDFAGNTVTEWYAEKRFQGKPENPDAVPVEGLISIHHQPHELPNGHFVAMVVQPKFFTDYPTNYTDLSVTKDMWVMGDKIVEFDRQGNVHWEWNSFDYLDAYRVGYGAFNSYWHMRGYPEHVDWSHGNGVAYDPKDNSYILSLRHQAAFIKVDRETKEIKWILGPHIGWNEELSKKLLKPVGDDFAWPWYGHNPRVTEDGNVILYDNGLFQAFPPEKQKPIDELFSRGVEYKIDEENMTIEQVWASAHSLEEEDAMLSWAMSDAHRLPTTQNHMVIDAIVSPKRPNLTLDDYDHTRRHVDDLCTYGRIREFSKNTNDVLYEVHVRDLHELIYWNVFGGVRIDLTKK
ncbi:MAG: aryl-sulfate sulfotransferase [Pseudomonadota bacterium]